MKIILPAAELWPQHEDWREQVARCARVCYAADQKLMKRTPAELCERLKMDGHLSMFRHATRYFVFQSKATLTKEEKRDFVPAWVCAILKSSPYCRIVTKKTAQNIRLNFVSTNMQFLLENPKIMEELSPFEVSLDDLIGKADALQFHDAYTVIRYTVLVTTQISTTRELNRTSPNNIAEQSTRFVNFGRTGGITIVKPHWYDHVGWFKRFLARTGWRVAEFFYNMFLRFGLPPEDAREFLPLNTGSRVCYTYNVDEWRHIMQLRMVGTTGKPHPNAKHAAWLIHDVISQALREHSGDSVSLLESPNLKKK